VGDERSSLFCISVSDEGLKNETKMLSLQQQQQLFTTGLKKSLQLVLNHFCISHSD
jgi:hypothetical protein